VRPNVQAESTFGQPLVVGENASKWRRTYSSWHAAKQEQRATADTVVFAMVIRRRTLPSTTISPLHRVRVVALNAVNNFRSSRTLWLDKLP